MYDFPGYGFSVHVFFYVCVFVSIFISQTYFIYCYLLVFILQFVYFVRPFAPFCILIFFILSFIRLFYPLFISSFFSFQPFIHLFVSNFFFHLLYIFISFLFYIEDNLLQHQYDLFMRFRCVWSGYHWTPIINGG